MVRLTPNGALDSSFGNGGMVETPIGKGGWSTGVAIQPDGKIVVSGWVQKKRTHVFAVFRFNTNGTRDASFGSNGLSQLADGTVPADVFAIGLDPWGDIFGAGTAGDGAFQYLQGVSQQLSTLYLSNGLDIVFCP